MTSGFYVALKSAGIIHISFTPSKGAKESLALTSTTNAGEQTGWLAPYQDKIYAISRTQFSEDTPKSGGVFAFKRSLGSTNTALTSLNKQSSNGEGGVHVAVSPDGKTLAAANITASTVTIYPLLPDGSIGEPTNIFDYNESDTELKAKDLVAHPHECAFDPTGEFMFVPARSGDCVYVYSVQGPDKVVQIDKIELPSGSGPRHTSFRQVGETRSYMYLISERDNVIRTFALDYGKAGVNGHANGHAKGTHGLSITLQQTISTLGSGLGRTLPDHKFLAGELALSNDGKFAYASNRGTKSMDSDTVAIYSVRADHSLTFLEPKETGGKTPRNFALSGDKDNRWVAVANEVTQDIVVFERDVASGLLTEEKGRISLGELDKTRTKGPVCIVWT